MLDEGSSSLCGIVILIVVVSLFFIPNSALASTYNPAWDLHLFMILILVAPIALVYFGIIFLRSFSRYTNFGNHFLNNRSIVIGLNFLAGGIGWTIMLALLLPVYLDRFSNPTQSSFYYGASILSLTLVILFFSIGGILIIKYRKSKSKQQDLARNKERISE